MSARYLLATILLLSPMAPAQESADLVPPVVLAPKAPAPELPRPAAFVVAPIAKGDRAPFAGLLVPEIRFAKFLEAELRVELLEGKLWIEAKKGKALDAMYLRHLERATEPVPWYEKPSFNRWVGFGLGVAFTGLGVYGSVKLYKAIK